MAHYLIIETETNEFLNQHVSVINENKTLTVYVRGAVERETVESVVVRRDHLGKRHWGLGKALRNRPPRCYGNARQKRQLPKKTKVST